MSGENIKGRVIKIQNCRKERVKNQRQKQQNKGAQEEPKRQRQNFAKIFHQRLLIDMLEKKKIFFFETFDFFTFKGDLKKIFTFISVYFLFIIFTSLIVLYAFLRFFSSSLLHLLPKFLSSPLSHVFHNFFSLAIVVHYHTCAFCANFADFSLIYSYITYLLSRYIRDLCVQNEAHFNYFDPKRCGCDL